MHPPVDNPSWGSYPKRLLLTAVVVVVMVLIWMLADVLVLVFGSIVVAVVLRALARLLQRRAHVPERWSVLVTVLLLALALVGTGWWIGGAVSEQVSGLREQLPHAWEAIQRWLASHALGRQLLDVARAAWSQGSIPAPRLGGIAGTALGAIGLAGLMVIVAVYLAADPGPYRRGTLRLVPPAYRDRAAEAMDRAGEGLLRWLRGQGVSMLFIGVSTGLGLWLLDVPLALTLGLLSGLLAFVPFYGSIAGGVVSVVMGFVAGPQTALWVALMYLAVQQLEELILLPLVQRWAVSLPPVLGLIAPLIFGVLFGPLGVVFATPLMVVAMILVKTLYVQDVLKDAPPAAAAMRRRG